MKKTLVFIICAIFCSFAVQSQNFKDTLEKGKVIEKRIIITSDELGDEDVMFGSGCNMKCNDDMSESCCPKQKKHMRFKENRGQFNNNVNCQIGTLSYSLKAFVLMPIILFIFVFIIFLFWLRRENFKLSDAISSRSPVEIIKTTHTRTDPSDHSKTLTETHEETIYPRSTSRLLAFISGITAIIIAICLITYIAYFSIKLCTPAPHLGGLWIVFLILGIGMIPYAVKTMFKK